ncbi:hypothetical protein DY000_02026679 [Brassica cretica]|uniref:Uncharacterized protein n=1 Tax=Brassica cretica TaxID=69181 RepID=A0ABQ7E1S6_BRACR|nr:hypothetical protein DY000_02026679 [Brassica cretica]
MRRQRPSSSIFSKGVSRVSGFGVVDMRSRGFSARSSQINNVGSIDQALMQSMEQKLDCFSVCQHIWSFATATNDDAGDGFDGPRRERHQCMV